ncbi:MAG: transcription antitermination factor NusB [Spirochaetales bacterium]|jgi:N utilization substance protein B|nr:transcription antitermination factor NusB [Spirochaetales bacterium]
MGPRRKGRILAVQALFAWDFSRPPVEALLSFSWEASFPPAFSGPPEDEAGGEEAPFAAPGEFGGAGAEISGAARDFAAVLTAGTIENIGRIDEEISRLLEHWDFSRLLRIDLAILRVSAYSLLFIKDIPATVVIDEAVDIAKEFGTDDSYRFVNGILDALRKTLEESSEAKNHEA